MSDVGTELRAITARALPGSRRSDSEPEPLDIDPLAGTGDLPPAMLAAISRLAGQRLIDYANELLVRGEQLLSQAGRLDDVASTDAIAAEIAQEPEPEEEEKPKGVLNRSGEWVTDAVAITTAKRLGEFTKPVFATELGLRPSQVSKFIRMMMERSFPVVQRTREGKYIYVNPREQWPDPRDREQQVPPERRVGYGDAPANRGMPVRVAAVKRATRRQRSTAGAGGIKGAKAKDARYNRMQEAKEKRAQASRAKSAASQNGKK